MKKSLCLSMYKQVETLTRRNTSKGCMVKLCLRCVLGNVESKGRIRNDAGIKAPGNNSVNRQVKGFLR
jgi:hypothetical protein